MASGTQQLISLEIDTVGLGLTQDLGAWRKVHPTNKKEIEDIPRVGLINLKTKVRR